MAVLRRSRLRILLSVLSSIFILPVAGCAAPQQAPQTTIYPLSPEGQQIQDLYALIFWLAVFVFVTVNAAFFYAIFRFRRRRGDAAVPPQTHGNTRLEIAWTIAPALVLAAIGVPTITTIFAQAAPAPAGSLQVRVIGHQWWWEFQYPELNIVTANEVHLVKGQTVSFALVSDDVIHSFWFPRLMGKQDVTPNHANHLVITPQEAGEYYGQCVEFCGVQHANMKMRAIVHATSEEFQAWVRQQQAPAAQPTQATQAGATQFLQTCLACHTVRGTQAVGKIGPDLTHFGSRRTIAAGALDNTPENLARWLRDPQEVKQGNKMTIPKLTEEQISNLAAYLQSLK